jgi:hypothetical protein
MSGPERRLRRERERRETRRAIRMAKKSVRAQGCVCAVQVEITWPYPDMPFAVVSHDDWCPFLRSRNEGAGDPGPQVVLLPREPNFPGK